MSVGVPAWSSAQEAGGRGAGAAALEEAREMAAGVFEAMEPVVQLLDTELADTMAKYRLELSFDPEYRDILDEDWIRLPIELRYGLSPRTTIYTEVEPFIPNPINGGSHTGISYIRVGGKNQLVDGPVWRLAGGLDADFPLSEPPPEPGDGYLRVTPYVVVERRLPWFENIDYFLNVGYQFVDYWQGYQGPQRQIFRDDNIRITSGVIQMRGIWNPFLRAEYRYETSGINDRWFVEPGVLADLPRQWTSRLPGKWKAELALRYEEWNGEGELELNLRVRWRVTPEELGLRR